MSILALGVSLDTEITIRQLVEFLQIHADDLRRWDGVYSVVDDPAVAVKVVEA